MQTHYTGVRISVLRPLDGVAEFFLKVPPMPFYLGIHLINIARGSFCKMAVLCLQALVKDTCSYSLNTDVRSGGSEAHLRTYRRRQTGRRHFVFKVSENMQIRTKCRY